MKKQLSVATLLFCIVSIYGQTDILNELYPREHILFDFDWKFALGHAYDTKQDFNNGTGYFSYFAKTGFGDGAAAENFDDRAWRKIELPHDWCVELPFSEKGNHSHGYKTIGRNFPENSVGWYRKTFTIPEEDLEKKISIEFEGVFRNSIVWVNGFYLGTEPSGYTSFEYDITDYLNYGGENVVAVRVDATMEEGWYYEGAGIYRHVYLNKMNPLYVDRYGSFVTTEVLEDRAIINIQTTIKNSTAQMKNFRVKQTILDARGKVITEGTAGNYSLNPISVNNYNVSLEIKNPHLWSIESPYIHCLLTEVIENNKVVDKYKTPFGIRRIKFDPDKGFFLNGHSVKIVGSNNHKDHAGVGTAMPDALIEWRIRKMKEMGANGIRTSHDPPSPAFLDACDRLGMLVLAENRLSGSNQYHLEKLESFMKRDRNHPSIVLWSLGNEEWAIEGNDKGVRITETMQNFVRSIDSSRAFTTAITAGWDDGTGKVIEVIGYNYIAHGDIDEHHKKFPWQPGIGTEETNTSGTRGIYISDNKKCHLQPTNTGPTQPGAEYGWNFYNKREFLSGLFYWTGFDYRGEPSPYNWPAVTSQFGIFDLCGFQKDIYYYLQSWWQDEPVIHMWPHWNWLGNEGEEKVITVYSNCDQVELFLNDKSLGKKDMPRNGHLEWPVPYEPGKLVALGYLDAQKSITSMTETTGQPDALLLIADRTTINADNMDAAIITVQVNDEKGRMVPTADIDASFEINGPGKIIGVGNGDPSSHEPGRYFENITTHKITDLKELPVDNLTDCNEVRPEIDDSNWKNAFETGDRPWDVYEDTLLVVRGNFILPEITEIMTITYFAKSIVKDQSVYINGHLIASNIKHNGPAQSFLLDHSILKEGKNVYAVTGQRFRNKDQWDVPNRDAGLMQIIEPAQTWKRKTFNGLAQIIVQSTDDAGEINLTVKSDKLQDGVITITSK